MTDDEIKKLAALADEATPGPWLPTIKKEVGPVSIEDDQSLGMVIPCEDAYTHADAVYIAAANPTAIKGLIERLKQAETQRDAAYMAVKNLYRGYVNTLEAGLDRITSLGGECDSVEVMERSDPVLIAARAFVEGKK